MFISFPGALAWPNLYPWPQRPPGLIETAFDELAKRWLPIFNAFDDAGCSVAFELHPGEDLFDGTTFEMFLERVKNHPRCCINYDPSHFLLQQLDYLEFIDIYHERITSLHIKTPSSGPTAARASTAVTRAGWTGPAGSARWATARSTSAPSSPSSPPTTIRAGQCWSGSAR